MPQRIRVLEAIAGADFSWAPGDVVEVSDEAAEAWADGHRAELVDEDQDPAASYAVDHRMPVVVGEDGQELEVLDAEMERVNAPDGEDDGLAWVRWLVTVRLPAPAAESDGTAPPTPEDNDPAQEAEVPEPLFDPREHTNKEVLAYLDTVGEQEALRVLDIEANKAEGGENRAGIGKNREQVLEAARARDAAAGGSQAGAEKAADYSRGGGGAQAPETRDW
ncbi:hypothetical protein ACFUIY_14830 [Streptomyces griseorubiginosus]|uniref:hypothetical protein n=1 Tax=Streptomyces griseorubiginosus TaxID=67304 RepID=UPI0036290BD0